MLLDCPVGNSTVVYNAGKLGKFKVPNIRKRNDDALWLQILKKEKYIYGIKTLIPLAMGLTKYSATKFTILNALATIIWACIVGYLSYTAGSYILTLSEDFKYFGLALVLLIFLIISYVFKKIEK